MSQERLESSIEYMALAQNELVVYTVLIKLAREALDRSRENFHASAIRGEYCSQRQQLKVKLLRAYFELTEQTESLCNYVDEGIAQAMVAAAPLMQGGDTAVLEAIIEALRKYKDS